MAVITIGDERILGKIFVFGETSVYVLNEDGSFTRIEFPIIIGSNETEILYDIDGFEEEIPMHLCVEDSDFVDRYITDINEGKIISMLDELNNRYSGKKLIHNGEVGILVTKFESIDESEFLKEKLKEGIEKLKRILETGI